MLSIFVHTDFFSGRLIVVYTQLVAIKVQLYIIYIVTYTEKTVL